MLEALLSAQAVRSRHANKLFELARATRWSTGASI